MGRQFSAGVKWGALLTFSLGVWGQRPNTMIVGGVLYLASMLWEIQGQLRQLGGEEPRQ